MKPFFKNKNPFVFVRYGSLNLKKQEFYSSDKESFHKPPVKYGFYAMPLIIQELFLIGCIEKFQSEIFCKEPDYDDTVAWDLYEKQCKKIKRQIRRVFEKKDGFIWHHLKEETKLEDVVAESGSWVKTSVKVWEKSFRKSIFNERIESTKLLNCKITEVRSINGCFSKDKYELFIDEKIN